MIKNAIGFTTFLISVLFLLATPTGTNWMEAYTDAELKLAAENAMTIDNKGYDFYEEDVLNAAYWFAGRGIRITSAMVMNNKGQVYIATKAK
jgi:hypothetical protein